MPKRIQYPSQQQERVYVVRCLYDDPEVAPYVSSRPQPYADAKAEADRLDAFGACPGPHVIERYKP
jgi:hypothetical protein